MKGLGYTSINSKVVGSDLDSDSDSETEVGILIADEKFIAVALLSTIVAVRFSGINLYVESRAVII